ncbi:MAG: hypothetical protein DRO06_01790 [Thermoproteota archaeon]|nr:MAG: hypothetical protein DRO06_01770 [Candidatus Korarchaeota archaeon]RLG48139.1 MAG: hypothetical protein DRO06_01790 [Candidatus Korarchaeota archaeon]
MSGSEVLALAASAAAVASGLAVVRSRSTVYAALSLALLGSSVSVLMAAAGFEVVAVFHLLVYVGAAVTFILFTVAMMREPPEAPGQRGPALLAAALLAVAVLIYLARAGAPEPVGASTAEVASLLLGEKWPALLVAAVALGATMIEAITLARRD